MCTWYNESNGYDLDEFSKLTSELKINSKFRRKFIQSLQIDVCSCHLKIDRDKVAK